MQVQFEFYGVLQALCSATPAAVDAEGTVADALLRLGEQYPLAQRELQRAACAVGDRIVLRSTPLSDGLTVALLPPVAGG
jgi:molybdopterin converting factor small subunit